MRSASSLAFVFGASYLAFWHGDPRRGILIASKAGDATTSIVWGVGAIALAAIMVCLASWIAQLWVAVGLRIRRRHLSLREGVMLVRIGACAFGIVGVVFILIGLSWRK